MRKSVGSGWLQGNNENDGIGIKKGSKEGENVEETYTDMIRSTIEVAKAMKYPGVDKVELADVVSSIKDIKCNAWRKHLHGITKMDPADVEMEDDAPENEDDLVIQGPILGKEATEAAAEAIHKLPQMLLSTCLTIRCRLINTQQRQASASRSFMRNYPSTSS